MGERAKPLRHRLRDAARFRYRVAADWLKLHVAGRLKHRLWRRLAPFDPGGGDVRLHVGSGRERLPGWVNVDLQTYLEADLAADITRGIPFSNVRLIYAEHFLEHLHADDAMRFLTGSHRALAPDGRIRLSTPNLDWVWTYVYSAGSGGSGDKLVDGIRANRAFYGWEHRFLWNREILEAALGAAGFTEIRWCEYGRSDVPELAGIERHETYDDDPDVPHVLIVEAGKGAFEKDRYDRFMKLLEREFLQSRKG